MKSKQSALKIGANIKRIRKQAKLTLQCVATQAEISAGILSKIENGLSSPSMLTLMAIATALQVDPVDLLADPVPLSIASGLSSRMTLRRKEMNLSLTELAEAAELPRGYLETIVQGDIMPSVEVLWRISKVLKVDMGYFFPEQGDRKYVLSRNGERNRHSLVQSPNVDPSYLIELLFEKEDSLFMEAHISTYVGIEDQVQPASHIGQEVVFVLNGNIRLKLDDETVDMGQGDAIYYDSATPHSGISLSKQPARTLNLHFSPRKHIRMQVS